jgi:broad specificity phosphatase PhoE
LNNKSIFYLARHGQTEWNIEHRIQGQLDSPLTEQGKLQSLQLGLNCKTLNITQILTSPLGRAVQTAHICAQHIPVKIKEVVGFEERHFGSWQGRLTAEIQNHCDYDDITSQITDCKPQLGESAKASLYRFESALKKELDNARGETYLIIIHCDILRCFKANLQQQKKSVTGYDYKNGEIISMHYDHHSKQFLIP